MVNNPRELVSRGGDCLGFAEFPSNAPKELTKIIFCMMQRVGRHAKRSGNAAPDAATLGIEHFAATDLVLRTKSQPGCKGRSIAKPRHICADLAEDGLGCNRADARHVGEIDSEDSIQLTAEVERLRLIPAPLICGSLGSFGYGWLRSCRCLQTAELTLNSPDPLRRPAVGSSGTQPATVGARTSALGDSHPQAISRSCPHCSSRHHDRAELRSQDLVRQRGLHPVSGSHSFWLGRSGHGGSGGSFGQAPSACAAHALPPSGSDCCGV